MIDIDAYGSLVFDCDGVLLNSNAVKTRAFYDAALPYGEAAALSLVDFHVANGGISRYKKFQFFLEDLVPQRHGPTLEELLQAYACNVKQGLMTCEVTPGLKSLRERSSNSRWLVASGGDQNELREVFSHRGIDHYFDGGIFGSPDDKALILKREIASGNISMPALFLGDSRYDYLCSAAAGLDFVFISQWTEVVNWEVWCREQQIKTAESVCHCFT